MPQGHAHVPEDRGNQPGPSHVIGGMRSSSVVQMVAPCNEVVPEGHVTQPPAVLSLPRCALYVPAVQGTHWPLVREVPASQTHCEAERAPGVAKPPGMHGMQRFAVGLNHAVGWQANVRVMGAVWNPPLRKKLMLVSVVKSEVGVDAISLANTAVSDGREPTSTMPQKLRELTHCDVCERDQGGMWGGRR